MDKNKPKFTRLQNEIFRLLCIHAGESLNQRGIAKILNISPTAVAKAIPLLEKENLVVIEKSKTMNLTLVSLNRDSRKAIELKRAENLKLIYESNLIGFLEDEFPGGIVILFGSYSYGEDTMKSDIDIAIIGRKEKKVNLEKFEKFLKREIIINFYEDFSKIHKNLRSNIFNGIVLVGRIGL